MERKFILLFLVIVLLPACTDDPYIDTLRIAKVSYTSLEIYDSDRERPLSTKVWYPTDQSATESSYRYDDGFLGYVAEDGAIIQSDDRYPLILLSHGTGGSNASLSWLAEILASNGYIVAAPNHWNNYAVNNQPSGIVRLWDRPKDLSYILSFLLEDETWGNRIAPDKISAAGYSAGGFTVLGLAGAKYSIRQMDRYCNTNPHDLDCSIVEDIDRNKIDISDVNSLYKDSRINYAMAMAPAVGRGVSLESLEGITIPVAIIAAKDDQWTTFEGNAKLYADNIPLASATSFSEGGHYLFLQECSLIAKLVVKIIIDDDVCGVNTTVDRRSLQHETALVALKLFDGELRNHN